MTFINNVTKPNLVSKFYFDFIYKKIANLINKYEKKIILDFGCGEGFLKKKYIGKFHEVINYDIKKKYSKIENWKNVDFDLIIFCQVLMYLDKDDILDIFNNINSRKNIEVIILFSNQNILNKLGSIILNHPDAHKNTITSPLDEENLAINNFHKVNIKNFFLFKLLHLKSKN